MVNYEAKISKFYGKAKNILNHNRTGYLGSYRPPMGLAAAMTEHLALSEATMPALVMEMVCCSMASWMEVLSASFILSNSSIKQTPC